MRSSQFNVLTWLTGYSGWSFYCAVISLFGVTGYYADLLRRHVPDRVGVGLLTAPLLLILFIQWGEVSDRVVAVTHMIAASWFMILALGMEVGHWLGYAPKGTGFYRILAHVGWTFAWAGIYRRARRSSEGNTGHGAAPLRRRAVPGSSSPGDFSPHSERTPPPDACG